MSEQQLTLEARAAIRRYIIRLIALPGSILAVVSFLIGFLLNDVARESAYNKAYSEVAGKIIELASSAAGASSATEKSLEDGQRLLTVAKRATEEVESLRTDLKNSVEVQNALANSDNIVDAVQTALLENKKFTSGIARKSAKDVQLLQHKVEILSQTRFEFGVTTISADKDYNITFSSPFATKVPFVLLGPISLGLDGKGEAFATMMKSPTRTGFSVRLVYTGAGSSKPGEWARGKINWLAIGTKR